MPELPTISDETILEIHDADLKGKKYCSFPACTICIMRKAEEQAGPNPADLVAMLKEENRILKIALEGMLSLWENISQEMNWRESALTAETFMLMNEEPNKARQVLGRKLGRKRE